MRIGVSPVRIAVVATLVALAAACAPRRPAPGPSPDAGLNAWLRAVERDVEAHRWDDVLAAADPEHRRTQVEGMGMGEAQYVAELLGLHRVGNDVAAGRTVAWTDLERIRDVELRAVDVEGAWRRVTGVVHLTDGTRLDLEMRVAGSADDGWLLTGAVG